MPKIIERIDEAYRTMAPDELEAFLRNLCDEAESGLGRMSSEYVTAYNELGTFYRGRARYDEGEAAFLEALSCIETLVGKTDAYATCLDNLGELYRLKGDFDSCEKCLLEAETIFSDTNSAEFATNLNYQGHLAEVRGDHEHAKNCYLRAIAILEPLSPNSIDLATGYQNAANAFQALGDLEQASGCLEIAMAMYRDGGLPINAHYVNVLNLLATFRYRQGDFEASEAAFDDAVDAIDATSINPLDALVVLSNAASLYRQRGASEKFDRALSRIEELAGIESIANNPLVARVKDQIASWH